MPEAEKHREKVSDSNSRERRERVQRHGAGKTGISKSTGGLGKRSRTLTDERVGYKEIRAKSRCLGLYFILKPDRNVGQLSAEVIRNPRESTLKRKASFWLTVSEGSAHGHLAPFLRNVARQNIMVEPM